MRQAVGLGTTAVIADCLYQRSVRRHHTLKNAPYIVLRLRPAETPWRTTGAQEAKLPVN